MPTIEILIAKFTNYIPSVDRKIMKSMLKENASLEQWISYLTIKIKEGLSRYAMLDFLDTQRTNLSIAETYYQNTLVDALSFLTTEQKQ